jgi:hypothetical protein
MGCHLKPVDARTARQYEIEFAIWTTSPQANTDAATRLYESMTRNSSFEAFAMRLQFEGCGWI